MIDEKELRTGNIVEKDGGEYVADWVTIKMSHNYNPIPLTSEILLKADFRLQKEGEYYLEYQNDLFIVVNNKMVVNLVFDVAEYIEEPYDHIKYVHQLQNLYYSLTGEELNIKL